MLGHTHLAFGVATTVTVVALAGVGLDPPAATRHISVLVGGAEHGLTYPDLRPAAWAALFFAAALGSLLPDIDQPGSLLTRMPANQAHALQRAGSRYGKGAIGMPARASLGAISTGGEMASAMLGGGNAPYSQPFRLLLLIAASLAALMFGVARWLPPPRLLALSVQERHFAALALACVAGGCGLMAVGGAATLVNHLPGHHRGWTHSPLVAAVIAASAGLLGPSLFPALPGVGAAFGLGYVSHLFADALTIRGIPLLWPGQHQPSLHLLPRRLRVRTGSAGEAIFNLCWPIALVIAIGAMAARVIPS
jgi:membrane-bound metal-dependent hydrolase YbcI (DUF457 family)